MPRDLKSLIDLEIIASELEKVKKVDSRSGVGFDTTWFDELVSALAAVAPFDDDVSEQDRLSICWQIPFDLGKSGPITKERLKTEAARRAEIIRKQQPRRFVFATSLSFRYFRSLRRRRLGRWTIDFTRTASRRFSRDFVPEHIRARLVRAERDFVRVKMHGRARTEFEAVDSALDELDFLRGTWNLALNRGVWRQRFDNEARPVNQICLGPLHTLHLPSGNPAIKVWWYELCQSEDPIVASIERPWTRLDRDEKAIRRILAKSPYGGALRKLLVRYCRALDSRDPNSAFLQLWGVLEGLTCTTGGAYDKTIDRAVAVYREPALYSYELEMLRARRNKTVHAGAPGPGARAAVVSLNRYVTTLFDFAMRMTRAFRSLDELAHFLDLPRERTVLDADITLRRQAVRFHGYTRPRRRSRPRTIDDAPEGAAQ